MKANKLIFCLIIAVLIIASTSERTWAEPTSPGILVVSPGEEGYRSISEAVALAKPGAAILVMPGVYRENLVIDKPVQLMGEGNPVIDGGGQGHVVVLTGGNITFQGFTVTNSGTDLRQEDAGIYVVSDNNRIIANQVVGNAFGIYLYQANNNLVEKNEVTGDKKTAEEKRGNGIHLWNSEHNTVTGNTVRYTRDGLYFSYANHNEISLNELTDQRYGVHYMYSNHNHLRNNVIKNNTVGAALMLSNNNTVIGNTASNNKTYGILYRDFDENVLAENILTNNQMGMFLYNSQLNEIRGNYVAGNQLGIHIAAGSQDNMFWHNSFVQNQEQVKHPEQLRNRWDNGAEGNYWSDYTGFDLSGNGIGEFPYRPNRLVEELVAKFPLAKLLYNSPILQALQLAEKSFPVLRPHSIVDNFPFLAPVITETVAKSLGQGVKE